MEGNNWYNRTGYTDYRNHAEGDERPLDQKVFRGAYRFDNNSPHHNETTYDGFDHNGNRTGNFDNQRSGQFRGAHDYERDWSGTYHNSRGDFDREDYRNNYTGNNNRNQDYNYSGQHQERSYQDRNQYNDGRQNRQFSNNMNTNPTYGLDNNNYNRGENYGNMAGSLSFGYDGTSTYNQDWNNRYDPMSGQIRNNNQQYRDQNFNSFGRHNRNQDDNRPFERL